MRTQEHFSPQTAITTQVTFDPGPVNGRGPASERAEGDDFGQNELGSYTRSANRPPASARRPDGASPASVFWQRLTSGELMVVETQSDHRRCVAVARERCDAASNALTEREIVLLHRVFQGELQKNLAFGFDLSMSTISELLGSALSKLGVSRRVRATPLPIVLSALKHCGIIELPGARLACFDREGQNHVAIGLPILDAEFLGELSSAERKIALLHALGANPAQIAVQRRTSACTVANQIAALCQKLHVRGRFELIVRWACLQWAIRLPAEQ